MAYTLAGTTLPNLKKLGSTKDAQLFHQPLPGSDSSSAIILDLFGCTRTLTLSGKKVDTEANCATFISWLDGLLTGSQSPVVLHVDISNLDYNVLISSIGWDYSEGEVGIVEYTISVIEASN